MESLEASLEGEGGGALGEKTSAMTWLQAAEHVLREEGPEMHIRELTSRIMEVGMVNSSCTTSLETLLYRQTSKGPPGASKFVRVPGKMGWFGLRKESLEEHKSTKDAPPNGASVLSSPSVKPPKPVSMFPQEGPIVAGVKLHVPVYGGGGAMEMDFEPRVLVRRKRARVYYSDGSSSLSSDDEDEEEEEEEGEEEEEEEEEDSDSSTDEVSELLYYKRYCFVKKLAKSMIYENAALADQLHTIEEKISKAEAERRFLLHKLMKFESKGRQAGSASSTNSTQKSVSTKPSEAPPPIPPHTLSSATKPPGMVVVVPQNTSQLRASTRGTGAAARKPPSFLQSALQQNLPVKGLNPVKGSTSVKGLNSPLVVPPALSTGSLSLSSSDSSESEREMEGERERGVDQSLSKKSSSGGGRGGGGGGGGGGGSESAPARAKKGSKVRRLQQIAVKKDGSPVFPIQVGGLKVLSLGKVVWDRPGYHTERYLLPVGFESCRVYPSMKDPQKKCDYICKILDGGETPVFEMVAEDDPLHPIRAASSTACQTQVLRAINKARDKQATNSGSGPEFFGYSNPTIQNLLQNLPDVKRCSKYKFATFEAPLKPAVKAPGSGGKKGKLAKLREKVSGVKSRSSRGTFSQKSSVSNKGALSIKGNDLSPTNDPSLTPVLVGQGLGTEAANLCSSSDDWSSDSDNSEKGLVIDG